jgi:hypothetical protein
VETTAEEKERVAGVHRRLEEALRGPLDEQWDEVLDDWDTAAPAQTKAVRAYVSGLRNRILRSLIDITSMEELQRGLAIEYIEMKCHWTMLNTRIQSQTSREGQADSDLIYRATCVSLIIQQLEPLLRKERVDKLTNFLAEPLQ